MTSKGLVLLTGANGYVAGRTIEALLQAGFSVRGTVRSLASSQALTTALSTYASSFSLVEVPDITVPGAFDSALQGVDIVAHFAAPVSFFFTDPEPVMHGAVNGTTSILESALKTPTVKHFVHMSSIVAVFDTKEGDYTFTEKDWNTTAQEIVAREGKNAPGLEIYRASKTAAEQALWKFRDERRPKFTVTALHPVLVAGPPLVPLDSPSRIHESFQLIWDVFTGKALDASGHGAYRGYVDVRDIAQFVVFSAEHPEKTDGERYILASSYGPAQSVADILRKAFPERKDIIQEGTPGQGYLPGYKFPKVHVADGTKAAKAMGREYTPWEKTVVDTAESLKSLL